MPGNSAFGCPADPQRGGHQLAAVGAEKSAQVMKSSQCSSTDRTRRLTALAGPRVDAAPRRTTRRKAQADALAAAEKTPSRDVGVDSVQDHW